MADIAPVRLGTWPTPTEPAPRLAEAIGLAAGDLWIKRDDLTGLAGGGNKVRKLEWSLGAARAAGADVLVTTGAAQSNHARLTAAAGARAGLAVHLVLAGPEPSATRGNLLLDSLLGATVHWAGDRPAAEAADDVVADLRAVGARPYLVPFGGSDHLTVAGYATAGQEILDALPDVSTVVTALGSGGTMAGLVSALGPERVLGVHVGAVPDPAGAVAFLADVPAVALRVDRGRVGAGYATCTPEVREAIELVATTEGVVLDPVYTGRAAAGLVAAVADGSIRPGQRVVLLHSGGLPGLFGHAAFAG